MADKSDYFKGLRKIRQDSGGLYSNSAPTSIVTGGSLMNYATGLGTFSRDKGMLGQYFDPVRISDSELQSLYNGNDLARRIIEAQPKEIFREGYNLFVGGPNVPKDKQAELSTETAEYMAKLRTNELFKKASIFGRLFGGVLLLVGADDGRDPALPLDESKIKSVRYLNFIDRRFAFVRNYYGDPMHPKFGEAESYLITNSFGDQGNTVIHESRVIRFDGAEVDILKRRELAGWTLSTLQPIYDAMRSFDTSFQAVSNLMTDASQGVFKMKDLINMVAAEAAGGNTGMGSDLQTRMRMVDMSRSSARMLLVDAESESFERVPTPFGGIPDLLDRFMMRLAAAAEMPVTVLFGRSPAGLNATGDSDIRSYYGGLKNAQVSDMEPKLRRIVELICLAKDGPTGGRGVKVQIQWKPLWALNDDEQARIEEAYGRRDVGYVTAGILLPSEVALSRFRNGQFSPNTDIDVSIRENATGQAVLLNEAFENGVAQLNPLTPEEPEDPQIGPIGQGTGDDPS